MRLKSAIIVRRLNKLLSLWLFRIPLNCSNKRKIIRLLFTCMKMRSFAPMRFFFWRLQTIFLLYAIRWQSYGKNRLWLLFSCDPVVISLRQPAFLHVDALNQNLRRITYSASFLFTNIWVAPTTTSIMKFMDNNSRSLSILWKKNFTGKHRENNSSIHHEQALVDKQNP